ncbi:radical SAM protein [Catellatospora citrea]|uniref:radical SAM/SPASM domain-containing protein n=1 Tax=Catellatospora citrea TaxID=53366 RepID=UPI0033C7BA28
MTVVRDVDVLWALRSPCNLGCKYCYFGTLPEHREQPVTQIGQLSHLSRADLSLADLTAFVNTLPQSPVRRVFLAGGEPLIWPPIYDLIALIKRAGVEVVVCTNGIPLNRPEAVSRLIDLGVDAVSVSLDSAEPGHNDRWRPAHNGKDGWDRVIGGITALLAARGGTARPAVGIYTVITAQNLGAVTEVAALAAELGCDYFVPQPLSLEPGHALDDELSLTAAHQAALAAQFISLYETSRLTLPDRDYPDRVLDAVSSSQPGFVAECFAGRYLFFVEPDGSVWPCPSSLKIASLSDQPVRTIRGATALEVFGAGGCEDCSLFSPDCVNMWPLTNFTPMIARGGK